jgi:hypothetical protein
MKAHAPYAANKHSPILKSTDPRSTATAPPIPQKVWLHAMEHALASGGDAAGDAARKLLERALAALPRRKHVKAISHAALLEFRAGSAERGRSMMEGVLRNYPRRLDLWSVYIDQARGRAPFLCCCLLLKCRGRRLAGRGGLRARVRAGKEGLSENPAEALAAARPPHHCPPDLLSPALKQFPLPPRAAPRRR